MTRLFGVIGHPIRHSLSPALHTAAFRALRLDALYAPFEVPKSSLAPILRALVLSGVEGLNVTVPLKEAILPLLDRVDSTAKTVGAVNTVVIRNRRTTGYNTDVAGFTRALKELGWPACAARGRSTGGGAAGRRPRRTCAVVLGAGGAARAVAWVLSAAPGSCLTIANRHVGRAQALARWLKRARSRCSVRVVSLRQVSFEDVDVLVNATTVGMQPADGVPIDPSALHRGVLVYDLVYHRETSLVQAARRRGCVAANGVSMLLYQGAESLRLWLRQEPPIGAMRQALRGVLSAGAQPQRRRALTAWQ